MAAKEFKDSSEALRFSGLVRKEAFISWNPPAEGESNAIWMGPVEREAHRRNVEGSSVI